mmetsp:Transcript_3425/g.8050  ORF Transcript_3425/g.8050 Transcript_3425/m.8050 type:complete len:117 (-) Transcript_3425:146-496(-)
MRMKMKMLKLNSFRDEVGTTTMLKMGGGRVSGCRRWRGMDKSSACELDRSWVQDGHLGRARCTWKRSNLRSDESSFNEAKTTTKESTDEQVAVGPTKLLQGEKENAEELQMLKTQF